MPILVLDTNALLFALMGSRRLAPAAAAAIGDPANELLASAISVFEVGTKHRKGKLALPASIFRHACLGLGVTFRAPSDLVLVSASELDWGHDDPWDRVIAATALTFAAPLVSSDRAFDHVAGLERIW